LKKNWILLENTEKGLGVKMTKLHWTEVDHVTTIWTESPPPLRAGLLFRTGKIDESLMTAGFTHLIEHLSFSAVQGNPQNHNGFVQGAETGFFTYGKKQDVSNVLANICDALTILPGERLEVEKQVLKAEFASRPYDLKVNLLNWRYGAAGYGLPAYPELGMQIASLEQLREYAAQRFTSDNAVLWLSGPIPEGLRLNLPRGIKHAIPRLNSFQQTFPCWIVDNVCGGIATGSIVPRTHAATIFCEIVNTRLRKQLREEKAVSYAPSVIYEPLNSEVAHLVFHADSEPNRREELVNCFGEFFQGLSEIDNSEFEAARSQVFEVLNGSMAPSGADQMVIQVQRAATDWIMGHEYEPLTVIIAQLKSVKIDDLITIARDLEATTIFALPSGAPLLPWCGKKAPISIWPMVNGEVVKNCDHPINSEEILYGSDGVSVHRPNILHVTVKYSDMAAAVSYEDGAIHLFGADGSFIAVEPTLWRNGRKICKKILEKIPNRLLIEHYPRPVEDIPMPKTTAWQRFRDRFGLTDRALFLIILLLIIMVVVLVSSYTI
jgi:predicted Zn-dependent peptidase